MTAPPLPQFFTDVRETEEQLRKLQGTLHRKYTCDRSVTVTRLEDLLQDAQVSSRAGHGPSALLLVPGGC